MLFKFLFSKTGHESFDLTNKNSYTFISQSFQIESDLFIAGEVTGAWFLLLFQFLTPSLLVSVCCYDYCVVLFFILF